MNRDGRFGWHRVAIWARSARSLLARMTRAAKVTLFAVLAIAALLVAALPALAQSYDSTLISLGGADADWPAITVADNDAVTQVAWVENGHVWTQITDTYNIVVSPPARDALFPPFDHGDGTRPQLCWTTEGFVLAFQRGSDVVVYRGDPFFAPEETVMPTGLLDNWEFSIDLWGNPFTSGTGSLAHLVVGGNVHWTDQWILHARLSATGTWSVLAEVASGLTDNAQPQASYHPGPDGPLPRIYFSYNWDAIHRLDWDADSGDWSLPVDITQKGQMLGGAMAADHVLGHEAVLSTMLQPPCPCNTMHASGYDASRGHWWGPEDIGYATGLAFDWPMSPNLHIQDDGTMHVFFYQLSSLEDMTPYETYLIYTTREQGVWIDQSHLLAGVSTNGLGDNVAMAVTDGGQPLFVYTLKNGSQPRRVWLARPDYESAVSDQMPAARATLTAVPNPFNPVVNIEVSGLNGVPGEVHVYDMRGRRVAHIVLQTTSAQRWQGRWDGRDDAGRALPSGTYLLAVRSPGTDRLLQKITLAR